MKAAFKVWQNFEKLCEGTKHQFQVLTDHRNLEYLHTKRLNPRQARWVLLFTHFHFTITYLPGSKNTKADTHSRQHESSLNCRMRIHYLPTLILSPVQWDIMTKITNAQNSDPLPLNCSPGKSYVSLFLCSPLCFWRPTMQADTITHVQNGSTMVPQAIYQKPIPQCP